jgi:hypothetical protein
LAAEGAAIVVAGRTASTLDALAEKLRGIVLAPHPSAAEDPSTTAFFLFTRGKTMLRQGCQKDPRVGHRR